MKSRGYECNCTKCNGSGIIPEFAHVAEGKCFACAGTGKLFIKHSSVSYAKRFLSQFAQPGYCLCTDRRIVAVGLIEMPYATIYLMDSGENYTLGQPICGGSVWWVFPKSKYFEFAKSYLKARGTDLLSFYNPTFSSITNAKKADHVDLC